jgi:hypothetical protein
MPASTQTLPSPTTTNFPNGISAGLVINTGAVFVPGSTAINLTAHAGGTQAAALALTAQFNRVDTVATAADSVKLPIPTYVGQEIEIMNNAPTNSLQVFGSGTDTINGVATATGVAQAAGKFAMYKATSIGAAAAWVRLLGA